MTDLHRVGLIGAYTRSMMGGGGDPVEEHGISSDSSVAYNLAVDTMWMYQLSAVSTDFFNLTSENNTIIHTEQNEKAWADIDEALDTIYKADLDGNSVPCGSAKDIGAFEYCG